MTQRFYFFGHPNPAQIISLEEIFLFSTVLNKQDQKATQVANFRGVAGEIAFSLCSRHDFWSLRNDEILHFTALMMGL